MPLNRSVAWAIVAVVCALALVGCGGDPGSLYPELQVVGGLPPGWAWSREDGHDFSVDRASSPDRSTVVGVYIGLNPSFEPGVRATLRRGTFAGRHIRWYVSEPHNGGVLWEALLGYRPRLLCLRQRVHLWILAASHEQAAEVARFLAHARIRERGHIDAPN